MAEQCMWDWHKKINYNSCVCLNEEMCYSAVHLCGSNNFYTTMKFNGTVE